MPSKLVPRTAANEAARSAVVASHHGDNAQWRALLREEILEPALPIIDSHHHLWQRGRSRYLVDEYLAEAGSGHDIRASVYVECGSFYRARLRTFSADTIAKPSATGADSLCGRSPQAGTSEPIDATQPPSRRSLAPFALRSIPTAWGPSPGKLTSPPLAREAHVAASELMAPVGEVEFANGMAAMAASGSLGATRVAAAIVGTADLTVGSEAARVLDAHASVAPERFRGIRLITKWDADEELNNGRYVIARHLMADAQFRSGFALLGPRKLSFDAMVYHPQLPDLADLARAYPDTTIVLNHIGGPLAGTRTYLARKDEAIAAWRAGMIELARYPNVYVKLGGLGMPYLGFGFDKLEAPAPSAQLAQAWGPYIEHCIEAFGPNRCMFESNFPPDRASVDFPVLWNAFKRIAARYSAEEKRALFHDTAAKAYRLGIEA